MRKLGDKERKRVAHLKRSGMTRAEIRATMNTEKKRQCRRKAGKKKVSPLK